MTKKEIIKQSLASSISVPGVNPSYGAGSPSLSGQYNNYVTVDLDKLAEFLAKHIELKAEDLITN